MSINRVDQNSFSSWPELLKWVSTIKRKFSVVTPKTSTNMVSTAKEQIEEQLALHTKSHKLKDEPWQVVLTNQNKIVVQKIVLM